MSIKDKLDYIKETKELIKEGLNNLGEPVGDYDTFRSYPEIIDDLYNNWPRVTDSGESVTLNQTMEAPLDIDLKGNTSQTGTPTPSSPIDVNVVSGDNQVVVCGKNLYDKTIEAKITNGCNVTTLSTGIRATQETNGTYRNAIFTLFDVSSYVGEKMTISANISVSGNNNGRINVITCDKDGGNRTNIDNIQGTSGFNSKTFTIPSLTGNITYLGVVIYSSASNNGTAGEYVDYTNLQITLGETVPTTYTPYTSQNYPLYLGVENLWNWTPTTTTLVKGTNRTTNIYPTSSITLEAGTYTIYFPNLVMQNNNYNMSVRFYGVESGGTALNNDKYRTITVNATSTLQRLYIYLDSNDNDNATATFSEIWIIKGSTPQQISDTPIELNKIGTYQDYIYKDNGKWYLHKEVGKVVLNGTEDWQNTTQIQSSTYYRYENMAFRDTTTYKANAIYFSNMFKYSDNNNVKENVLSNTESSGLNRLWIIIDTSYMSGTTTTDFKTWLGTNQPILYYVLATATDTEITNTTLINQLEALKGATSYDTQTNISQVNNDKPFILSAEALKGSGS